MQQHARAPQVAQEHAAEAAPLVRALNQAREVGQHGALARGHDAQVGHERGEGVGGDLWGGACQRRQQRGLACVLGVDGE